MDTMIDYYRNCMRHHIRISANNILGLHTLLTTIDFIRRDSGRVSIKQFIFKYRHASSSTKFDIACRTDNIAVVKYLHCRSNPDAFAYDNNLAQGLICTQHNNSFTTAAYIINQFCAGFGRYQLYRKMCTSRDVLSRFMVKQNLSNKYIKYLDFRVRSGKRTTLVHRTDQKSMQLIYTCAKIPPLRPPGYAFTHMTQKERQALWNNWHVDTETGSPILTEF